MSLSFFNVKVCLENTQKMKADPTEKEKNKSIQICDLEPLGGWNESRVFSLRNGSQRPPDRNAKAQDDCVCGVLPPAIGPDLLPGLD
jgi:hypothetical protein